MKRAGDTPRVTEDSDVAARYTQSRDYVGLTKFIAAPYFILPQIACWHKLVLKPIYFQLPRVAEVFTDVFTWTVATAEEIDSFAGD